MARRTRTKSRGKPTGNKRRKGLLAVALPWLRRFGAGLGAVVFVLWLGAWLWLSGSVQAAGAWAGDQVLNLSAQAGFRVENILVEGRVYSNPDIILALVNTRKGDPLFAFDPRSARAQLRKINWVKDVRVERRWPDTLYIGLEERRPVALWQKGADLFVLDEAGEVVSTDNLVRFKDLPVVTGADAPEHAGALAAALDETNALEGRLKRAVRVGGRRWDLYMKSGLVVKLPETGLARALERLAQAQAESGLLDKDVVSLDLREADRIAVRTRAGGVRDYIRATDGEGERI